MKKNAFLYIIILLLFTSGLVATPWAKSVLSNIDKNPTLLSLIKGEKTPNNKQKYTGDINDIEHPSATHFQQKIFRKSANTINYKGLSINIPEYAIKRDLRLSIINLMESNLHLPPNIVNLTKEAAGYRILPQNIKLQKEIQVAISYDKTKIPDGYTEKDIDIFIFDKETKNWKKLQKNKIEAGSDRVSAKTNGFSDFIAGIIKQPESPDTSGFTPTSISGLKASEPFVGIETIAPPTANSEGSANTSFNLLLPKGRAGMQPSLTLSYGHENGHSWLGTGWNLSLPSINIDTRWGVPRYDTQKETESYTLSGEELLPNAHRQDWEARTSDKQFFPRHEGGFNKIIRKGNSPQNYLWLINSKSGATTTYGGNGAQLKDASGNIGYWAIAKQEDLKGNTISYEYIEENGTLYPKTIYYTGKTGDKGAYSIHFITEGGREDVQISGRLGFKQEFNKLLKRIEIKYQDQLIRAYEFVYKEGQFHKTLLTEIKSLDAKNNLFYSHKLDYYDDVKEKGLFSDIQKWETPKDDLKYTFLGIDGFSGKPTLAGTSRSESGGVNFRLGIGIPGIGKFNENTIGGHGGSAWGKTDAKVILQDIDGDNLPDKIFIKDDKVYYHKNLSASGKNGFSTESIQINLPHLGKTKSNTYNFGASLQLNGKIAVNVGYDRQISRSRTESYFMDFNGDGLVDFANNGIVYYNRLINGVPHFENSSTRTPFPINASSAPLSSGGHTSIDKDSLKLINPLHDVVRTWTAPHSGFIKIKHQYKLLENHSQERQKYKKNDGSPKADGVRLFVQHKDSLLWKEDISADDYTLKTRKDSLQIEKGETLFFRLSSKYDGNYDLTSWTQQISYSLINDQKDYNGLDLKNYSSVSDSLSSAVKVYTFTEASQPELKGIFKKKRTTDKVILRIYKYDITFEQKTTLFEKTFSDDEGSLDISSLNIGSFEAGESIEIRVDSPTEINWQDINFTPEISFSSSSNQNQKTSVKLNVNFGIFNKVDEHYFPVLVTPQQKGKLRLSLDIPDTALLSSLEGEVLLSAKQNGKVMSRRKYSINNGSISNITPPQEIIRDSIVANKDLFLEVSIWNKNKDKSIARILKNNEIAINLQIKDSIKIPSNDPRYPNEKYEIITTEQKHKKYAIYEPFEEPYTQTLFGKEFRNWGSFILNGTLANEIIDRTRLTDHKGNYDDTDDGKPNIDENNPNIDSNSGMETSKAYFIRTTANYPLKKHFGLEDDIFVAPELMSPSRLGENDLEQYLDFSLPNIQGGMGLALAMINESKSHSFSSDNLNASHSLGDAFVTQTMADLNGDRFPDFIRGNNVQFTAPKGNLSSQTTNIGNFASSKTTTTGKSFNGGFQHGEPKSSLITVNYKSSGSQDANKVKNSVSISGGLSGGNDHSEYTHTDINGDGLTDRISQNNVSYNLGYSFSQNKEINLQKINAGYTSNFSAGLGYSAYAGSFKGGLNYTRSNNQMQNQLLDLTGDGLVDKVIYKESTILIYPNLGNKWSENPITIPIEKSTESVSVSYGGSADFSIPFSLWFIRFSITAGGSYGTNTNRSEATFMDINGDGHLDYIISENEDDLRVALSNIGRTNFLKSISNATGSTFEIDYSWTPPTYQNPNSHWKLAKVSSFDGHTGDGEDYSITQYTYKNPYYDRWERAFYGYETVKQEVLDPKTSKVLRSSLQEYFNKDFYRKGLLKKTSTFDKNNNLISETHNEYIILPVNTSTGKAETSNPLSAANLDSSAWLMTNASPLFIAPVKEYSKVYEGSDFLETSIEKSYDSHGNIISYTDNGNGTNTSKITAEIEYHESASPYFGGIPKSLEVKDIYGTVRKRTAEINPQTAEVTRITQFSDASTTSSTELSYDSYGNLSKIIGAQNYKGEQSTLSYEYDEPTHSHITKITDHFGYTSSIEYDYRFNTPVKTTDRNGESILYTLDDKGRTASILAPKEAKAGKPYTVAYEYYPLEKVPYAKTLNYDSQHNANIETYTYSDGLGRVIQVKKTASIFKAKDTPDDIKHIISGKQIYDALGRVTQSYYPTTAPISENFEDRISPQPPTKNIYDEKDRVIEQILPDQSSIKTQYQIATIEHLGANEKVLKTTITDALGRASASFTDVQGRTLKQVQPTGIETLYKYSAIGELRSVTDAHGNITESFYDLLGRRTKLIHPDAGTTTLQYDPAGNLIKRQTSQIREQMPDAAITYHYDFNRLKEIKYPKHPENNVRYHYGKATESPSRRGRLWLVEDASGGVEYFYGSLGEITKEIRTIRITPTDIQTYITQYEYDSWNRIQKMVYPDGEVLHYHYNRAGNLQSLIGFKDPGNKSAGTNPPAGSSQPQDTNKEYIYIKQQGYDEFEQKVYRLFGNNTETHYTYDPIMRRLSALKSISIQKGQNPILFQNNTYSYDLVGNILKVDNQAPALHNLLGGASSYSYQYDELNRLINAKGAFSGEIQQADYSLQMTYNKLGGITQKALNHNLNGTPKGYTLSYLYNDKNHPNAPSSIQELGKPKPRSYSYDGNGNPTYYDEFKSFRAMNWDEENRLLGINDNGRLHFYTYDHKGERALKSSGESSKVVINGQTSAIINHTDNYTAYISPYFVVNKGRFTKHYFEGTSRIVSKLGEGTFTQPAQINAGGINFIRQSALMQQARDKYIQSLGVPPGPPTQHGIYATPEYTGQPYPSIDWKEISQNQEPPEGWPRPPKFNPPGDVPGPPIQFGEPISPDTAQGGFGFIPNGIREKNIFFYHPDHLGSSSYITGQDGKVSQHTEYIAFGEILFDEHNTEHTMPYLFNGKELDQETNLTYFGARYLDMKTSLWLNTDPLSGYNPIQETEHYIDGQHNNGVFNPMNHNTYGYTYNNPIIYIDPNGKQTLSPDVYNVAFIYYVSGGTGHTTVGYYGKYDKNKGVLYVPLSGNETEPQIRKGSDGVHYRGNDEAKIIKAYLDSGDKVKRYHYKLKDKILKNLAETLEGEARNPGSVCEGVYCTFQAKDAIRQAVEGVEGVNVKKAVDKIIPYSIPSDLSNDEILKTGSIKYDVFEKDKSSGKYYKTTHTWDPRNVGKNKLERWLGKDGWSSKKVEIKFEDK